MNEFKLPERFIPFDYEAEKISRAFVKNDVVFLLGVGGIGKTVLAKSYALSNPLKFSDVLFYSAIEFEFDQDRVETLRLHLAKSSNLLVIIDGLNEILFDDARNAIVSMVERETRRGTKFLLTSRTKSIEDSLQSTVQVVELSGWDEAQLFAFLHGYLGAGEVGLDKLVSVLNNNPLAIRLAAEMLSTRKISIDNFLELITSKVHYHNKVIQSYDTGKTLISPTPKIIADVRVINSDLVDRVKRDPTLMHQLSSRQFEELVAELFDKEGYKVTLTQATRDGGKDLMIIEQKKVGNFIIYVECKRYALDNPVGVRLVRELYGTVMADKVTAGVLVTSSYFSSPAIEFKEQVRSQMALHDYYDLKSWISEKSSLDSRK